MSHRKGIYQLEGVCTVKLIRGGINEVFVETLVQV